MLAIVSIEFVCALTLWYTIDKFTCPRITVQWTYFCFRWFTCNNLYGNMRYMNSNKYIKVFNFFFKSPTSELSMLSSKPTGHLHFRPDGSVDDKRQAAIFGHGLLLHGFDTVNENNIHLNKAHKMQDVRPSPRGFRN